MKNKHIHQLCNYDIFMYEEYMNSIKNEISEVRKNIISEKDNMDVYTLRYNIHKCISIISNLDNSDELVYICKLILSLPKTNDNLELYNSYITMFIEYDYKKLF